MWVQDTSHLIGRVGTGGGQLTGRVGHKRRVSWRKQQAGRVGHRKQGRSQKAGQVTAAVLHRTSVAEAFTCLPLPCLYPIQPSYSYQTCVQGYLPGDWEFFLQPRAPAAAWPPSARSRREDEVPPAHESAEAESLISLKLLGLLPLSRVLDKACSRAWYSQSHHPACERGK